MPRDRSSHRHALLTLGWVVFAAALLSGAARAQQPPRIDAIYVEGTQRIEPETILSYMLVTEGDVMDNERIDRSLKTLFSTGLFADVTIAQDGTDLVVKVVENPIINQVVYEGNKKLEVDELEEESQLRSRSVYTRARVQADVERLLELYRRNGRFAASIEPKIIQRPQNRVDLVYEIAEGEPTYVRRIDFIGNEAYSDGYLRDEILTREERWWRFLTSNDTYDPDRTTYDRELLRRFYLSEGYADFRVVSAIAELTPDRESFFITFTVEEGVRYRVRNVDLTTTLEGLDPEILRLDVKVRENSWYNADRVEDTIQALTDRLGALGYAFVDIRPRIKRDMENRIIDINFRIDEGPRVHVNEVAINGNTATRDKVIRREIRLVEGDAFNTALMRRSKQRLENLDYFETVNVEPVPSETEPDRVRLEVDVEEKSTGELTFGLGFSTTSGLLADLGVRERNFLGRGQEVRADISVAQRQTQFDLGFTEPYLFDRELVGGIDFFIVERDFQNEASYDWFSYGESLRAGWAYTETLTQGVKYTIRRDKISNVSPFASRFIRSQAGTRVLSMITQAITLDERDNRIQPNRGYFVTLSNDLAGLGGDDRFLRTDVSTGYYWPFFDEGLIVNVKLSSGAIFGFNQDVRINNRYFLGGDNLRGFETAGVGARDRITEDALGGNIMSTGTLQFNVPLGDKKDSGAASVTGKIFFDVGVLGEPDDTLDSTIDFEASPRASVGMGVLWRSPMGPINIDLAWPVMSESFDKTEFFRINFGTQL